MQKLLCHTDLTDNPLIFCHTGVAQQIHPS